MNLGILHLGTSLSKKRLDLGIHLVCIILYRNSGKLRSGLIFVQPEMYEI